MYRQFRQGIKRFLWALDARASEYSRAASQPTVLFEVQNEIGLDAQAEVIRVLLQREHLQVQVVSGTISGRALGCLLQERELPTSLVASRWLGRHGRPAVKVITDAERVRTWRRTMRVYLHHGSSFGNEPFPYAFSYLQDGAADILFCISGAEADLCRSLCGEGVKDQLRVVGQPKLDRLANGQFDRAAYLQSLGLDPALPTILAYSHWRPTSLFRSADLEVIRSRLEAPGNNVIVTGHSHLFDPRRRGDVANQDWEQALRSTFRGPRSRVVTRLRDNRPLLAACDLLLSDHSSTTMEYALLGRPIVMYRHPEHTFADRRAEQLLEGCCLMIRTIGELPPAGDLPRHLTPAQQHHREDLIRHSFAHLGSSAARCTDEIEQLAGWRP